MELQRVRYNWSDLACNLGLHNLLFITRFNKSDLRLLFDNINFKKTSKLNYVKFLIKRIKRSHIHVTPKSYLTRLCPFISSVSSVQSLSCVRLFATAWIAACQASLSITNSWTLLKPMSIESVISSSHFILCHPLLLLPPIPPSIRVFSNESILHIRWPKSWNFSFSISPSNEHPGLISFRWTGCISLQSKGLSRVFSNTTVQKHQFFRAQLSSQSNSHIHTWPLEKP